MLWHEPPGAHHAPRVGESLTTTWPCTVAVCLSVSWHPACRTHARPPARAFRFILDSQNKETKYLRDLFWQGSVLLDHSFSFPTFWRIKLLMKPLRRNSDYKCSIVPISRTFKEVVIAFEIWVWCFVRSDFVISVQVVPWSVDFSHWKSLLRLVSPSFKLTRFQDWPLYLYGIIILNQT